MGMVSPTTANCPFDDLSAVLCCVVCGGCSNHVHATCDASQILMVNASVARCGCCNRAGVLCCAVCGCCGLHNHGHP
jgi:hypothetical protein